MTLLRMKIESILLVCLIAGFVEISLAGRGGGRPGRRPSRTSTVECPALECPDSAGFCPHGWKQDENGCRLCECKPSWRCRPGEPQPTCRKHCPEGFIIGADRCPTCQCYDPAAPAQLPAPETTDGPHPEHHHHHDHVHGRHQQLVAAQLPVLPTPTANTSAVCGPMCLMYCPNGMKTDANGCPICECNDDTASTSGGHRGGRGGRPGRRRGQQCTRPTCAMYCPNGYRRDQTGCTLCECHQPGDATFQLSTDRSIQCAPLACHRTRKCAHGFASDQSSGCPSCVCRTAPGA